jgi:hypothetical protein
MRKRTIQKSGGGETTCMVYVVKTVGYDFKTHEETGRGYELIDLNQNELFSDCQDEWDIEDQVEVFWNRLNELDSSWHKRRTVIVKVLAVYSEDEFKFSHKGIWKNLLENPNCATSLDGFCMIGKNEFPEGSESSH